MKDLTSYERDVMVAALDVFAEQCDKRRQEISRPKRGLGDPGGRGPLRETLARKALTARSMANDLRLGS